MIEALIKVLIEAFLGKLDTSSEPEPDPAEVQRRREEVRKFLEARRQAQASGTPPPPLPGSSDSEGAPLPPQLPRPAQVQTPPPLAASGEGSSRPVRPIPEPKPSTRQPAKPRPTSPAAVDWAARQHDIEKELQSEASISEEATRQLHKRLGEARRKASNARQDVADASASQKSRRLPLGTRADLRRAVLLREVLGPCRAVQPHSPG